MYSKNSRGARIEPIGTPQPMELVSEFKSFITVT